MNTPHKLLAWSFLLAVGIGACTEEGTVAPEGNLKQIQPDCLECMRELAECTSTAQNEDQFVGCRDVFQTCQEKMKLGPDRCGRPSNEIACELCQERNEKCKGEDCDLEFGVCKTFLMSRDQDECSEDGEPTLGTCQDCVDALAACAFGGEQANVCENGFEACREANKIGDAACPAPAVEAACAACDAQHEKCGAASGSGCDEGWTACVSVLATEGACGSGPNNGEGGSGGGGGGCTHDACEVGDAMDATCSACVTSVCDLDAFCCESAWDEFCVQKAQSVASCGCAPVETCEHSECTAGAALDPDCSSCAQSVCDQDGFCCTTEWDGTCVLWAEDLCASTCG
jgi:hypothetical protein